MKDMQVHLEKLQQQTAEFERIRDLAIDQAKRELFAKLAKHFKTLGDEVGEPSLRTTCRRALRFWINDEDNFSGTESGLIA